jgi:hypothetical protein
MLVARAFVPNPKHLPEVNHKNGIKSDCAKSNLEWRTRLGNARHAAISGLKGNTAGIRKVGKRWAVRYYPEPYKRKHLGMFDTLAEAKKARIAALKKLPEAE